MDNKGIDPLWLLLICGPLGSLAGYAALLRSGQPLDKRAFIASILNSGLLAIAIAVGVFQYLGTQNPWLVILLSILSGLGGMAMIDFALALFKETISAVIKAWANRGSNGKEN